MCKKFQVFVFMKYSSHDTPISTLKMIKIYFPERNISRNQTHENKGDIIGKTNMRNAKKLI